MYNIIQTLSDDHTDELHLVELVENERLVTKTMTEIHISMTTFGLAIIGG